MSKPMIVEVPHSLPRDEARRRLEGGFDHLKQEFGNAGLAKMEQTWSGDAMTFVAQALGQAIHGRMEVRDRVVHAEVYVPAFLRMIAGPIKNRIQKDAHLLLR